MSRISVYSLSRLQPELEPALRKTLEAVAGVIERQEVDGLAVQERAATHVHIRVGPLLVFFRGAFGLERSAFVQFGHFVLDEAGRTRHDIDGEWSVGFGSIFPHELAQKRRGEHVVGHALDHVVKSVAEKHENVRLVDGVVQPAHTLVEQDDRW
ncbi:MAG TPA: hypothetical protein VF190_00975 [Rhodothermales bacterium]|jgi:hypothetical protein